MEQVLILHSFPDVYEFLNLLARVQCVSNDARVPGVNTEK